MTRGRTQPLEILRVASAVIAGVFLAACSKGSSSSGAVPSASTPPSATVTAPNPLATYSPGPMRSSWPLPVGPRLAVEIGKGLGPIRFGATVQTIERLMAAPCDLKTTELCRYYKQAIDFELKDGVLARIHVHRTDRSAGKDATGKPRTYGVFNGMIPPDLRFGMLPWAIQEYLGKPRRIEPAPGESGFDTAEIHYYDGVTLEFDRIGGSPPVLGGIIIEKHP
jgi:hypothetical protein